MSHSISMARRPLIGVATVFVAGVALGLATGQWVVSACGWLAMAGAWLVVRHLPGAVRLQGFATMLAVFATGWLVASTWTDHRRAEAAWLKARDSRHGKVVLRGTVSGDVDAHALKRGGVRYQFALRQVSVVSDSATNRITCIPVNVTWYGPATGATNADGVVRPTPASGEIWQFTGKLRVKRLGVLRKTSCALFSNEKDSVRSAEASLRDWDTLADRARQVTAMRLARGIEGWGAIPTLVQAMFLGTRSTIPPELNQIFRDSGTIHIFAISGMNVAILAVVLIAMLSMIGVPRQYWCLPLAPILIFYTVATGLSASALRACLMAVLYFGAPLLGRKPDGLSTLAAAAVIALAMDPFQLQDAGFGLSFACMIGLLLVYQPLAELLKRWWRVDEATLDARASAELGGELAPKIVRRRVWWLKTRVYLADLLAMSIAAWLTSTPLTAWYFGRITPAGILANLPIEPAAFFEGVASGVSLVVGLVSPWFSAVLNNAAGGLTLLMIWVARVTVMIPGGALTVPNPPLWLVGCWYAGIFLLTGWLWRLTRAAPAGAAWLKDAREAQMNAAAESKPEPSA